MGFQDVAFLPSRATFSTTFIKFCGRVEILLTTTHLKAVDVGMQGHTPCKIPLLQQNFFCVS